MKKILFILFIFTALACKAQDFHFNGVVIGKAISDPTAVDEGQIYFNSVSKTFRGYNGTSWEDIGSYGVWGSITGDINNQTDFWTVLDDYGAKNSINTWTERQDFGGGADLQSQKITGLLAGTLATDAVNKAQLDAVGSGHAIQDAGTPVTVRPNLNFNGSGVTVSDNAGNSSTDITINGGSVEGISTTGTLLGGDYIATIGDPDSDANIVINQATETITITTGSPVVLANGANLNGNDLINVPTPVNPTDGANKAYVDASIPSNLFDPQPLVDAYEFVLTDADGVIYYHSDFGVTKTASIADDATTDFPTGSVLQVQQHTSTLSPITVDFLQGVGNRVAIITDTNANKDLGVSFIKMADDYWNVRGDYTYTTYSPPSATNYYDLANAANFDTEVNASTGFTAVGYMTVASVADTDGASAYSIEAARTTGTGGAINVQTSISGLTNGATYTVTIRAKKDITSGDDPYYTILNATGSGVQSITTTSYAEYVSTVTMTDTTMTILFYLESDVAGNKVQISSIKVED